MSLLLRLFKRVKNVNITICGLDNAGKTAIINYLINGEFVETIPTMGVNKETIDLPKLKMNVFDLGGQEDFRGMWTNMNEKSDALIYVIDSTDLFRLEETKDIFYNIIDTQIKEDIPVLILLNKIDLEDRISRFDFIERFGLNDFHKIRWVCYETSAKTGDGIYEAFHWFVNQMQEM